MNVKIGQQCRDHNKKQNAIFHIFSNQNNNFRFTPMFGRMTRKQTMAPATKRAFIRARQSHLHLRVEVCHSAINSQLNYQFLQISPAAISPLGWSPNGSRQAWKFT